LNNAGPFCNFNKVPTDGNVPPIPPSSHSFQAPSFLHPTVLSPPPYLFEYNPTVPLFCFTAGKHSLLFFCLNGEEPPISNIFGPCPADISSINESLIEAPHAFLWFVVPCQPPKSDSLQVSSSRRLSVNPLRLNTPYLTHFSKKMTLLPFPPPILFFLFSYWKFIS